jgi:DNA polymerase-3 subunit epsilon/ATP-dependent DNA helicase DinG
VSTTYVAVDVETTGLDPSKDEIIEIAAVTFRDSDILDEYSSLVNPGRVVPPEITRLTGITQAMVNDAPSMFSLRGRLKAKLADHVLVGHNIDFDLGFLRANQLGYGNHRIDTVTLAGILVPEAGRFGLESLARHLNFPIASGEQHRALYDTEQTIELFLALRERALALSMAQLEEIVEAGRRIGWPETLFFEDVLRERTRLAFEQPELRKRGQLPRLFNPPKVEGRQLAPAETPSMINVEWLTQMIEPGGHFEQFFEGFEHRPQQVEMMQAVADAFNRGQHVLVEAGTGTGKSIGYLLPAAFWATQNDRRVVISTNTINLQDQLIGKDIPALQRALGIDLRAAIRKGRSNYLCTRLFQQMRRAGPGSADEMSLYARLLTWLPKTETGDVGEVVLRTPGERMAWSKLNAENPVCTRDECAAENCPLHIARQRSEIAHLIVVNHSLLVADIASGEKVLPPFVDLIVDEAHHLEAAVTDGLSFRADRRFLENILDEAIRPKAGTVANAQTRIAAAAPADTSRRVDAFAERLRADAQAAVMQLEDFFTTLGFFLQGQVRERSQFAQQIRLVDAVRVQPDYQLVEESWDNLGRTLRGVAKGFSGLVDAVTDVTERVEIEGGEELRAALMTSAAQLEQTCENLDALISKPSAEMIYWVEQFKDNLSLHAAPLNVGPLVRSHIFEAKETVIMTSATLRTAAYGSTEPTFDYLRSRLSAHETDGLSVGSPFDYRSSTLLYLVSDIPEPNQPGYQRALEQAIVDVAVTLGGKTLVLFTANNHLSQTAQAVEGQLAQHQIVTLAQTSGMSRQQLLEQFKREDGRTVLLGTRSFWEGVDIPGPALSALLITKLPFDVPSDPIFAARSETYENAFYEYSIPEAVLRFRQGFGRLIRRIDDEGVVVILDKRVLTKRYGEQFLEALPTCTTVRQRADRLNELLLRWFGRDRATTR